MSSVAGAHPGRRPVRVWAPAAGAVHLVADGDRAAMEREAGGWWRSPAPGLAAGERYRLAVDGGPPRPDPRSPWQPDGVDGPSATVDHSAFDWTDRSWRGARLASSVLYELHVGTFTPEGTFDAAAGRLDHLAALGVDAVELLPVVEFPGERGWGYDGVLLYAPHHAYGGPDGLKRFVDAAHAQGIAVVLDVVYNHLGPAGNHLAEFGPYFTDRYSTPWGAAVNFDGAGSDEVRRFVIDNALMWLRDYHADGLRLDAVHAIVDQSALHLLEEMAAEVGALADATGRARWLIAESDRNDPRLVRPPAAGGYGLDASWSDEFHHALHSVLTGERDGYYTDFGGLAALATALERVYVHGRDYSPFRDRHHGRPAGDIPRTRFLGYLQNHDQVGNRAVGERVAALVGPRRAKVGAGLLLTAPFVPMLFQGEEWGASTPWQYFTDHPDRALGAAVSRGRRREFEAFGWDPESVPDPQDPETWRRSVLDWSEPDREPHAGLLAWHRSLIGLRRATPALGDGRPEATSVRYSEAGRWMVVERGPVSVAANLADHAQVVALRDGAGGILAASEAGAEVVDRGISLPADSLAVVGPS